MALLNIILIYSLRNYFKISLKKIINLEIEKIFRIKQDEIQNASLLDLINSEIEKIEANKYQRDLIDEEIQNLENNQVASVINVIFITF